MIDTIEYAQLSSHVYGLPGGSLTPLANGWSQLTPTTGNQSGFTASAYRKGDEVVIVFAGTDEGADWSSNIPAAIGAGAAQLIEALEYALAIMELHRTPNTTFSLSGHSLGGGLASMVAVLLDINATVFDAAPFQLSAHNPIVLANLGAYVSSMGYSNAALDAYMATSGALFFQREQRVTEHHIIGEALGYVRNSATGIHGSSVGHMAGLPPLTELPAAALAIELHSMDLLSSVLRSEELESGLVSQNRAHYIFSRKELYEAGTDRPLGLISRIHNLHIGMVAAGQDGILDALGQELSRIGNTGAAYEKDLNEGILAALAEHYYYRPTDWSRDFIESVSGGIQLDLSNMPAIADGTGRDYLLRNTSSWLTENGVTPPAGMVTEGVVVQSGTEGLQYQSEELGNYVIVGGQGADNVSAGVGGDLIFGWDGNDVLSGGQGVDRIYGGEGNDTLYSGSSTGPSDSGSNRLYGGDDDDILYGSSGSDLLDGGTGANTLQGGDGFDYYNVSGYDTIFDSDGKGAVFHGDRRLTGGKTSEGGSPNVYYGESGEIYVLNGSTLLVNGTFTIENFSKGDLGIFLEDDSEDDDEQDQGPSMNEAETRMSPLTIDLNGDGVGTVGHSPTRYFDHDANGFAESTAWVDASDGLLVRDLNGNGVVDDGRELFGSNTRLSTGVLAGNGFLALADMDQNHDGVVDSSDAGFNDLRVWRDLDGDGFSDAGELLSLDEAGIAALRTQWSNSSFVDSNGQAHRQVGTAIRTDGQDAAVSDVWYTTDATHRLNRIDVPVETMFDVGELPDARAFGNLMDLHQAMALNPALRGMTESYLSQANSTNRASLLRDLIFEWAGVTQVPPTSRGAYVDARELAVLELMAGRPYTNQYWPGQASPYQQAGNLLTSEFEKFLQFVDAQISAQAELSDSGVFLGGFSSGYERPIVDWVAFEQYIVDRYDALDSIGVADMLRIATALASYSPRLQADLSSACTSAETQRPGITALIALTSIEGTDSHDLIAGTSGDETINGGAGDDVIRGMSGDDIYIYRPGDGQDTIFDSGGNDSIHFLEGVLPQHVTITRDVSSLIVNVSFGGVSGQIIVENVFEGTEGLIREGAVESFRFSNGVIWNRDQIVAAVAQPPSDGDDSFFGSGGNDSFNGSAGADVLFGYGGADSLFGGDGADSLHGGSGNDSLHGGRGNDRLEGGSGNDTYYISLGDGEDAIVGLDAINAGIDTIVLNGIPSTMLVGYTTSGGDLALVFGNPATGETTGRLTLFGYMSSTANQHRIEFSDGTSVSYRNGVLESRWVGGSANDHYFGITPRNTISGGGGDDILVGGQLDDTINGDDGNDLVYGGGGNDSLHDSSGNDTLYGGAGDDSFHAVRDGGGLDEFFGGEGDDVFNYMAYETGAHEIYSNSEVVEAVGEGIDTIVTNYYNFTLSPSSNVENLIVENTQYQWHTWNYQSVVSRRITGNELDNTILVRGNPMSGAHLVIDGGAGSDTMIGSNASETYVVDAIGDVVIEDASFTSVDTVRSHFSYSLENTPQIENIELVSGGTTATGNAGNNRLDGSSAIGSNVLTGGVGDDTYVIGADDIVVELENEGFDTVEIRAFPEGPKTYFVDQNGASIELFKLHADAGASGIVGNDAANLLVGNGSGNYLAGGGGNDELRSGGSGYQQSDTLDGGDGDDLLIGGHGTGIQMIGGTGNDEIKVGTEYASSIMFNRGDGNDVISSNNGITNGQATLTFGASIDSANVVWSRDGNDLLIQFSDVTTDSVRVVDYWTQVDEQDQVSGVVDSFAFWYEPGLRTGSTVEELNNRPPSAIGKQSSIPFAVQGQAFSYVIPADIFSDEDVQSLVYSVEYLPEWLTFDPATRTLYGTAPMGEPNASFVLIATDAFGASAGISIAVNVMNVVQGTTGNDTLNGTSGSDMLIGLDGNDTLNGGLGTDRMVGGSGSDTYFVDSYGDVVVEEASEGDDLVNVSTSNFGLSDHVERLTFTSSAGESSGYGNELNNTMTGNSSSNSMFGYGGNDTLLGNNGNDYLSGDDGNDTLNGGSGTDEMYGGLGNDRYVVDANDYIEEVEDEGIDLVEAAITYTLGDNFENLTLTGTSGVSGNGNSLDNVIAGNSGANTLRGYAGNDYLDGGAGNDTMIGGVGDDTYVVGVAGDVVTELASEGVDKVISGVTYTLGTHLENLTLSGSSALNGTGNASANLLVGNSGANTLTGLGGHDVLEGMSGADTLTGGTGNDLYLMARGYGSDTVIENDASAGNLDVARFLSGVTYDQLWFRRPSSSNNLEIAIIGTSDKLIIKDWYLGNQYKVEEIRTSDDAMLLTMENVQTLVTAMSAMTMPAQGQTTLTTAQRDQLTTAFASAWQSQPSQQRVMTSLPTSATEGELPSFPTRLASSGGHVSEVLQASKSPSGLCGGMIWDELNGIDLLPSLRNVQIKPMLVSGDPLLAERGIRTKPSRMDVGDDLRLLIEAMAGFNSYGQGSLEVHQAIAPHDVRIALPLT